jgi:uncharacterized protein YceK
MRKPFLLPVAVAAGVLLAGCGSSVTPTSSASTRPTASSTGAAATGNVAACHKVDAALTSLTSLAGLKHPTAAVLEARFTSAAGELHAASRQASSPLRLAISQFDYLLSTDARGLRTGTVHRSSLVRLEAGLAISVRAIEARCEGVTGKP